MGNRGRPRGATDPGAAPPTGSGPTGPRSLPTRAERRRLAKKVRRRRRGSAVREIPVLVVVALLIALVLKTFLVQAFVIPSGSMEQTIRIGDRVLVDKLTPWFGSKPQRGDVVVFKDPGGWLQQENPGEQEDPPIGVKQVTELLTFIGLLPSDDEQDLIKRVIAVGGDTVKCCGEDGRVTVNGVPLAETYLHPDDRPSTISFEVKVPPGRLFMMGDHRSDSADSRFHLDGPDRGTVSEEEVVGRAVVIAWPFGHWSTLEQRDAFGGVPDARASRAAAAAPSNSVAPPDPDGMVRLPTPAELPLVMGVVGLHRIRRGQWHVLRSGCGGFGGRRTIRTRRTRGPAGARRVSRGRGGGPAGG
ncbi:MULTISPECIES: signal peptidase I [Streptomyces]|uniref:Signal peptidase I n=1 Tax=Streptomyces griseus subsp. griseus (strain JCM 4626 / CBS 651.72 / NBRC 13350 / KCC S-0626 / ISP 5235) TaxID=455632 RepID=B1VYV7_STRGG|nr:signal peptidase I [Streptomyces griseus]MBW3704360.1 signal peptidase I [Streptomyces griseus]BAG18712.1 putative signal peptidase I [Streptomyces griseus subsp. griseus NBRC 13350]SED41594.1 signal peptidase I [Streptomyces griseus]SQA21244.1 signal peptidase I [Streptomyces griseus]